MRRVLGVHLRASGVSVVCILCLILDFLALLISSGDLGARHIEATSGSDLGMGVNSETS